jgi:hypothetical protein
MTSWRADWSDRLGLKLERRTRIRPDEMGLSQARAELVSALKAVDRALAEVRERRSEFENLLDATSERVRSPARA